MLMKPGTMMLPFAVILAFVGSVSSFSEGMQPVARPLPDVLDYFPEVNKDASSVSWAHGVNSRELLNKALDDNVMMIEADVSYGYITNNPGEWEPVMAHPPATFSDITFKEWIEEVLKSKKKIGIKLDFKSINIVEQSMKTLQKHQEDIVGPLWLNADVLPGPVNASAAPVDPENFVQLCHHYFPASVLSLGWTTTVVVGSGLSAYSWHNVIAMDKLLHQYSVKQRVTFPVRAIFVKNSFQPLKWLVDVGHTRTLTVWSNKADEVEPNDLYEVRTGFEKNQVFYDLPSPLREQFWAVKDRALVVPKGQPRVEKLNPNTWVKQDGECARVGSEAIVFFGDCLAIYMEYYHGTVDFPITISGILQFSEEDSLLQEDSLSVGLRSSPWMWVRISANGNVTYPQNSKTKGNPLLPASHCYEFHIIDSGSKRPVHMRLRAVDCSPLENRLETVGPVTPFELDISSTMESRIQVAISSTGKGLKVLHTLKIHVPSSSQTLQPLGILGIMLSVNVIFWSMKVYKV